MKGSISLGNENVHSRDRAKTARRKQYSDVIDTSAAGAKKGRGRQFEAQTPLLIAKWHLRRCVTHLGKERKGRETRLRPTPLLLYAFMRETGSWSENHSDSCQSKRLCERVSDIVRTTKSTQRNGQAYSTANDTISLLAPGERRSEISSNVQDERREMDASTNGHSFNCCFPPEHGSHKMGWRGRMRWKNSINWKRDCEERRANWAGGKSGTEL